MRKRLLLAAVSGIGLAMGTGGVAHAIPSYADAQLTFTSFAINGLQNTTINNATITTSDGANYPGYSGVSQTSPPGSLTAGSDVTEATSGPGPFVGGQNDFNPELKPNLSLTPAGTRADALISGPITGATAALIAEGKLSIPNQTASSTAGSSTTINITFTATTGGTLAVNYTVTPYAEAQVGQSGDSATATISASYKLIDTTKGGTPVQICEALDGCTTSSAGVSPNYINTNASATAPGSDNIYNPGSFTDSLTSTLIAGDSYQLTLGDNTQTFLVTAAIPEPASLLVLGSGLVAAGLLRRRR